MKTICLYFQVHQPFRLRQYRFFDIGNNDYYYDDYNNDKILSRIAKNCYLPTNELLLNLIKKYKGKFRIAFSISGTAIDQFSIYAPEVIESFQRLAATGCVEFLAETYSHSLAALKDQDEFINQVNAHSKKIQNLFGLCPEVFRNTELIYSNSIGELISSLGFKAILTEGAKQILDTRSPNFLYTHSTNPNLKILLRNFQLSDDIAFRFSDKNWKEYPLMPKKYVTWLKNIHKKEQIINLFMDYETFGEHQKKEQGILKFLKQLPFEVFENSDFNFLTPTEVAEFITPASTFDVPHPISWADEARDLSAWLGNELQNDAFNKLYDLSEKIAQCTDHKLLLDWRYLQTSDHFYYMSTKFFADGDIHTYFNPYESPYVAFMNYMNILNDFSIRLNHFISKQKAAVIETKEMEYEEV